MKKSNLVVAFLLMLVLAVGSISAFFLLRHLLGEKSEDQAAFDTSSESGASDENGGDNSDASSPEEIARLIFIHHSTGENWLADDNGKLGEALAENNYYVSDTNYGWGVDSIGDLTDIGHWWLWFRGPNSEIYLDELYKEGGQNSEYSRPSTEVSGENEIIMFKSCFPNSSLGGYVDDPILDIESNMLRGEDSGSIYHTVANAKGIYIDLLEYFETRTDKLFIVITAPPLSDSTYADNARAFNNWLVNDWLDDYAYKNVAVFDFYDVLADPSSNTLKYPSGEGDDHPSNEGNLLATEEFIPFLNSVYRNWQEGS